MKFFRNIITIIVVIVSQGFVKSSDDTSHPDIEIIKISKAPIIDGQLSDIAWREIAEYRKGVLSGFRFYPKRFSTKIPEQQRIVYLGYDKTNLYIAMQAYTPDVFMLRSNKNLFANDCVEIHVKTTTGTLYQIGLDINNANILNCINASDKHPQKSIKSAVGFGLNFWVAELAIKWSDLGISPTSNAIFYMNVMANQSYQGGREFVSLTWYGDLSRGSYGVSANNRPLVKLVDNTETISMNDKNGALGKKTTQKISKKDNKIFYAYPTKNKPNIDGKLSEEQWKTAEAKGSVITKWYKLNSEGVVSSKRRAYLLYDDENLYIGINVECNDTSSLVSRRDQPEKGDSLRIDFEKAATGVDCHGRNLQILFPYILPVLQAASINDGKGWSAEIEIPWSHIGGKPSSLIPLNLFCNDSYEGEISSATVKNKRDVNNFKKLKLMESINE